MESSAKLQQSVPGNRDLVFQSQKVKIIVVVTDTDTDQKLNPEFCESCMFSRAFAVSTFPGVRFMRNRPRSAVRQGGSCSASRKFLDDVVVCFSLVRNIEPQLIFHQRTGE